MEHVLEIKNVSKDRSLDVSVQVFRDWGTEKSLFYPSCSHSVFWFNRSFQQHINKSEILLYKHIFCVDFVILRLYNIGNRKKREAKSIWNVLR